MTRTHRSTKRKRWPATCLPSCRAWPGPSVAATPPCAQPWRLRRRPREQRSCEVRKTLPWSAEFLPGSRSIGKPDISSGILAWLLAQTDAVRMYGDNSRLPGIPIRLTTFSAECSLTAFLNGHWTRSRSALRTTFNISSSRRVAGGFACTPAGRWIRPSDSRVPSAVMLSLRRSAS